MDTEQTEKLADQIEKLNKQIKRFSKIVFWCRVGLAVLWSILAVCALYNKTYWFAAVSGILALWNARDSFAWAKERSW